MKLKGMELLYNASAHFAAANKYPEGLIKELQKGGQESFDALCWVLAETAKQAELMRRHLGENPKDYPNEDDFRVGLTIRQLRTATEMAVNAVIKGLKGDEPDEDEEIDLGLLELESEKKSEN